MKVVWGTILETHLTFFPFNLLEPNNYTVTGGNSSDIKTETNTFFLNLEEGE